MFTRLSCILIALSLVAFPSHSLADSLKVAASEYCPLICDKQSEQKGVLYDLLTVVFESKDTDISFGYMPYARAIMSTIDGTYDLTPFAGLANSEDLLFVRNLNIKNEVRFAHLSSFSWKYTGIESLKALRIGIPLGFKTGNREVDDFIASPDAMISSGSGAGPSTSQAHNLELLKAGRIDVMLVGSLAFNRIASHELAAGLVTLDPTPVAIFENHIAVSPRIDNADNLREFIEERVSDLRASGRLKQLFRQYDLSTD